VGSKIPLVMILRVPDMFAMPGDTTPRNAFVVHFVFEAVEHRQGFT
jgi:hypothetical protein